VNSSSDANSIVAYGFHSRDHCPACAGDDTEQLYAAPFSAGGIGTFCRAYYRIDPERLSAPYELRRCHTCTLVFQRFSGDRHLLTALYSDWVDNPSDPERDIDTYRVDIAAPLLSRDAHEIMAAAAHLKRPLQTLRTLDYGMGWGLWARMSATLGAQSWGLDISEARQLYARSHGIRTVTDEDLPRAEFDFINLEQLLEHVPEPLPLLQRLGASLAPGGIVKISVPSAERSMSIVRLLRTGAYRGDYQTIMPIQPLEHVNSFTRRAVEEIVACAGLELIRPSLAAQYAFVCRPGAMWPAPLPKIAKELVRPLWQWRARSNIYVWATKRP
jgi:2-polyprenyl-3-methyl-5-hydroxy-6-metoxy-1,4-benzoquinol methylase